VIYAGTNGIIHATFQSSTSGLVGTVGVRIIDSSGATIKSRVTSGITEPVAGSGLYIATINVAAITNAPPPGHYYLFWDDGSATPGHIGVEDLYLMGVTTFATAIRALQTAELAGNAENLNVGFVVT
jgi:hypothetical protein